MPRHTPSLRRVALVLCLPVLIFAGMGVWMIRAERVRVEAEWRAEAARRLEGLLAELPMRDMLPEVHDPEATRLENQLAGRGYKIPRWLIRGQEPPAPGKAWEDYQHLLQLIREGRREEGLKAAEELLTAVSLTGFPTGLAECSPSGTPLLPLIYRAKVDLAGPEEKEGAAGTACGMAVEAPSALTGRIVQEMTGYLSETERKEWQAKAAKAVEVWAGVEKIGRLEKAAGRLSSELDTGEITMTRPVRAEWSDAGLVRHISKSTVQILPWDELHEWIQPLVKRYSGEAAGGLGLTPQIAWHMNAIHLAKGVELATGARSPWRVWIYAPSADALAEATRARTNSLTWVLANVLLVVIAAMGLTFYAFKKQARLARLQSEFVASVSHELRTPVASIGVLAERLEEGRADAAQTADYHRFIAREGRRLAALVDNVLDFSRIERGAKAYDFEHADLPRLVRETAALMRPHAEEKGLTLTEEMQEVPEHLWPAVDAVAIRQALVNLLDNAIKFTPSGGTVTVKFSAMDRNVMINVTDTGIGIPAGEYGRIFERFHRLDNGLRRETTGAGIGLSIVKHIAEAHGAKITVVSEEGKFSVFSVQFAAAPSRVSSE